MPQRYNDEDMDDILSSIMHGQQDTPSPRRVGKLRPRQHNEEYVRKPKRPRILLKVAALLIFVGSGAFFLFSYLQKSDVALFAPKSPFNEEILAASNFPLIFPSSLPQGFSIDRSSVSKASDGSIVYSLKDSTANTISVSLQKQPENINLQPLLDTMTEVREITIPAGNTVIGITPDNMLTTNTLSGEVWIIVRFPKGLITDEALDAMLKSFRQA